MVLLAFVWVLWVRWALLQEERLSGDAVPACGAPAAYCAGIERDNSSYSSLS